MNNKIYPCRSEFEKLSDFGNAMFVFREMIADCFTPVAILSRFYRNRTPEERISMFLFESREESRQWGRYSYLGLSAAKTVTIHRHDVRIIHKDQKDRVEIIPHKGKPMEILRTLCQRIQPVNTPDLPDLPCGLVGYFSYEIVSLFDSIPVHLDDKNDDPLASFVIPDEIIAFDNLKQRLYICVLSLNEDGRYSTSERYEMACDRLHRLVMEFNNSSNEPCQEESKTAEPVRLHPLLAPEDFESRVEQVKQEIIRGEVIQLVLSQPFVSHTVPDPIQLYRAQRLINPSPYMFFLNFNEMTLVGSSPETMVRLKNGHALVRPIAGTRPRGLTPEEDRQLANDLLNDEKECAEHLMLVDLGRNDLGRVARPGSVLVNNLMYVERYSHVMHLVSDVTAEIEEGCDAFDLFRAAFPAGTLSGAPKIRAMQLIYQYEDYPRHCYGGAVGYISFSGNMDFAITIRTAAIDHGRLTVQAGAGLVYDSVPERERQETINKAKALSEAIALIPQLDVYNRD